MNDDDQKFERGVAEFNAGRFFEAHEAWEELWLSAAEPEKTYLQGLIQIAAAFHHHARRNPRGAQSLLLAGIAKLNGCPSDFRGIGVAGLQREATRWVEILCRMEESEALELPKIRVAKAKGTKRKRGG